LECREVERFGKDWIASEGLNQIPSNLYNRPLSTDEVNNTRNYSKIFVKNKKSTLREENLADLAVDSLEISSQLGAT